MWNDADIGQVLKAGLGLIGLMIVAIGAFLPMFSNNFVWDDQEFIVNNPGIRFIFPISHFFRTQGLPASGAIYPATGARPVTTMSLAIDYSIWRLDPFGYHLTNLLLHILCMIGIFLIAKNLWRNFVIGFVTAVLFALHPGHAEAVIAFLGRSDLMATLFIVGGFLIYLKERDAVGVYKIIFYSLSLISFALAVFSKETGLVLFFILILYDFILS